MKIKGTMSPWAKWLTARMKERKWTIAEVCRRTGVKVDHSTLRYQIRNGRKPNPATVEVIERAFNVKCSVFL